MIKGKRNLAIDLVKGVAIIAVVIGHLDNCADVIDYMPYKVLPFYSFCLHIVYLAKFAGHDF